MARLSKFSGHSLAVLRIVTALLFMQHGTQKLFGFPIGGHHDGSFQWLSLIGIGGILEAIGGLLILLGLFTRATAFLLCGQMAVAYFMFHLAPAASAKQGIFPIVNGGDLAILFCFVFLHLSVSGPGAWSLDALRAKSEMAAQ